MEVPFIPAPHEEERLRAAQQEVKYRCVYEEVYPGSGIENVRFQHRTDWRSNPDFFSIQNIRSTKDGTAESPSYFWTVIGWLFAAASVAPFIMRSF